MELENTVIDETSEGQKNFLLDSKHTDIVAIRKKVQDMTDEAAITIAYWQVLNAKKYIGETYKLLKQRCIEIMQEKQIHQVSLWDRVKIYIAKKKKGKFETEFIYKALGFTSEQIAVLPKNPDWKKTEVLKREAIAPAFYEVEEDVIELKEVDEALIERVTGK